MVVPGLIGLIGWIAVLTGTVGWMLLTLPLRKWTDTGLTPLGLTPVLSHLLVLALGFEL
jgi:energy-converting hydrogenase Eha subunit C